MENKANINNEFDKQFTNPIIRAGRFTNLMAIPLCFLPALVLWFVHGAFPGLNNILQGWFLIASIYLIYAIVEPISYFPVLGISGTYMSFLSGNIGNMRVPCSAIAQEVIGVEPGSHQAQIVSTLGIAGSIVTNIIVTTIAAFGGAALMSVFPPIVLEAFTYVSPGIFGAMFGMNFIKNPTYGTFALVLAVILLTVLGFLPTAVKIPVAVFGTVAFALLLEKNKK